MADYFYKVGRPGSATTMAAPGHNSGGTTITVGSTANWPTDTKVAFAIDRAEIVAGEEVQIAGTYTEWTGQVTGATTIGSMALSSDSPNSDQNYAAGSLTRVYIPVSATRENNLIDGILEHANQDGTLKDGAVDVAGVIASDLITNTQMATAVKPETNFTETTFDFVASGCVWSGDAYASTRNASMTAGVVYIGGKRVVVSLVTARSFTASKDVYIDVDNTGTLTYTDTTTNAASPALAANSIRLGIIVVGATNIAAAGSVNQGQENRVLPIASSIPYAVTDSLGNLICPRDPNRKILGYRQITSNITDTTAPALADVAGLSVPVIVPANRKIKITAFNSGFETSGGPNTRLAMAIRESSTTLQLSQYREASASLPIYMLAQVAISPSTGSHTYVVSISQNAAGTMLFSASSTQPAYILVELV